MSFVCRCCRDSSGHGDYLQSCARYLDALAHLQTWIKSLPSQIGWSLSLSHVTGKALAIEPSKAMVWNMKLDV